MASRRCSAYYQYLLHTPSQRPTAASSTEKRRELLSLKRPSRGHEPHMPSRGGSAFGVTRLIHADGAEKTKKSAGRPPSSTHILEECVLCCFHVEEGARAFVRSRRALPTKPQKTTPHLTPSPSGPALAMQLGSPHPRRRRRQHQKRVCAANKWNGYGPSCFLPQEKPPPYTTKRAHEIQAYAAQSQE